jgi:hypothetical protein
MYVKCGVMYCSINSVNLKCYVDTHERMWTKYKNRLYKKPEWQLLYHAAGACI